MNTAESVDRVEDLAIQARQRGMALAPLLAKHDLLLTDERRWQIMAETLEAFAETLVMASVHQIAREVGDVVPPSPAQTVKLLAAYAQLTAMRLRAK